MISPPRRAARISAAIIAVCCLALPAVASAAAEAPAGKPTVVYTPESFPAWEAQLKAHTIASVEVNKLLRSFRTKLKDGTYVVAKYPKKQGKIYRAKLVAAGAKVTILTNSQAGKEVTKKKKPHKHKIRYIVGGVVIVLIIVGGIVLLLRRRRGAD